MSGIYILLKFDCMESILSHNTIEKEGKSLIIFCEGRLRARGMEPSRWLFQERLLDTGRPSRNMVSADCDKDFIEMRTTMESGQTKFSDLFAIPGNPNVSWARLVAPTVKMCR